MRSFEIKCYKFDYFRVRWNSSGHCSLSPNSCYSFTGISLGEVSIKVLLCGAGVEGGNTNRARLKSGRRSSIEKILLSWVDMTTEIMSSLNAGGCFVLWSYGKEPPSDSILPNPPLSTTLSYLAIELPILVTFYCLYYTVIRRCEVHWILKNLRRSTLFWNKQLTRPFSFDFLWVPHSNKWGLVSSWMIPWLLLRQTVPFNTQAARRSSTSSQPRVSGISWSLS